MKELFEPIVAYIKQSIDEKVEERLKAAGVCGYTLEKNVLSIDDVSTLTGLSKSHIYKLTSSRQLPHYKPNGKLMYFDRKEVEEWMKQNRVETVAEAERRAIAYSIGGCKK
jgi:excisionase family DNA binding protein